MGGRILSIQTYSFAPTKKDRVPEGEEENQKQRWGKGRRTGRSNNSLLGRVLMPKGPEEKTTKFRVGKKGILLKRTIK